MTPLSIDPSSKFYYIIGSVIGMVIIIVMAIFFIWVKLSAVLVIKYAAWKERRLKAKVEENQRAVDTLRESH